MWITDWTGRAACRGTDPDELFVQGAAQNRAKLICRGCPVRTECLADALDNGIEFGVWGGMTERERRMLLRRRPDIIAWRDLLERARDEYERQSLDELIVEGFADIGPQEAPPTRVVPAGIRLAPDAHGGQPDLRRQHPREAGPSEADSAYTRLAPIETEVRQCCDRAYKPLLVFLVLAGQPYLEARATAQLVLTKAYLEDCGGQLSAFQLRQVAQVYVKRPLAEATGTAFPADLSVDGQHVLKLIASLPESQRLALAWETEGCSPASIAKGTAQPLESVLESLRCGRAALKSALDNNSNPQSEWEDDDAFTDADLDALLMAVANELADAVEEADIAASAEAIMADLRTKASQRGPENSGDLHAIR